MRALAVVAALAATLVAALPATGTPAPRTTVYLLDGERLRAAHRDVAATPAATLRALLAGATKAERSRGLTTAVPRGTKLRSVRVARGTATVDLTRRFAAGGGTLSMQARLAQLVYTATGVRGVERVRILLGGRRVRALGGEGVLVEKPLTRADFPQFRGILAP